jgi:hypothetical protein
VRRIARALLIAQIAASFTPVAAASAAVSKPRAPNGPPLAFGAPTTHEEEATGIPSAAGDQLVENGLSSPLCASATRGVLSHAAQSNC